jgi:hypothetical protein
MGSFNAEILNNLPDLFHPNQGDPIPEGLVGAKILRVGTLSENPSAIEGGGLVIDYERPDDCTIHRIVFGFNELGMWLEDQTAFHDVPTSILSQG